jgi:hypothetical protein
MHPESLSISCAAFLFGESIAPVPQSVVCGVGRMASRSLDSVFGECMDAPLFCTVAMLFVGFLALFGTLTLKKVQA